MEEQTSSSQDLLVDETACASLKDTTRWSGIISIVLMICMGFIALGLIAFLFLGTNLAPYFNKYGSTNFSGLSSGMVSGMIGMIFFIMLLCVGVITYYLYRFSTQTRKGIDWKDQLVLEKGISSLRIYLAISCVFSIFSLLSAIFKLIKLL
ncbi:MAG: hypothetical protein V4450_16510 [Bacteroidota bacterium]